MVLPLFMPAPAEPLVSIVTPCFQSAELIGRCVESVLAQDYPLVEHVIHDGGSTDGTARILARYGEAFPDRVRWHSEPDRGQNDGLDRALKRCRGDIILVLNADDMLLPHAARWGVTMMDHYPDEGVIYGGVYIVDIRDQVIGAYRATVPYAYDKLVCVELVPPAQAAFIRRTALDDVGLGTDPSLPTCPDYEMWVRLGRRHSFRYVPGMVCKYRHHEGSGGLQLDLLPQLVADKRAVMDRLFDDPTTPEHIRALRPRAYQGLALWAVETALNAEDGATVNQITEIARTVAGRPALGAFRRGGWILLRALSLGVRGSLGL